LYCDGVPFDPELMGKKISQNVLLADRTIPSLPASSVSCDQTLGAGAGIGSTAKASTTTLPPSEPPVPAALPRSDPK